MPVTSSSSDTYGQVKRAFRNIFQRKKFDINFPAVVKPQTSTRPPRPRSASAIAAPEVFTGPEIPSWPMFGQLPQGGGLYCAPVELPASLAPTAQFRSMPDVGQPLCHSDLFSELDATSVLRLSIIGSGLGEDEDLEEGYMKLQAQLNAQQQDEYAPRPEEELATLKPNIDTRHEDQPQEPEQPQIENPARPEIEQAEQTQDEALFQDAEEHLSLETEIEGLVEPANIALPEGSFSDLEKDSVSLASDPEELIRNDSANDDKVFHDDSSSFYSTDESEIDVESTTDAATVSTPRTVSLARADVSEFFDEKIPVLSEPPQVIRVTPAPGMAATSGPLEEFSW